MPVVESVSAEQHLTIRCNDVELALQRFTLTTDNGDTLHDLRVALRRLQSLLRSFTDVSTQQVSSLRDMLKATNRARDLEVYLAQLNQLNLSLPHLEKRWQEQLSEEIHKLRQTLPLMWQHAVEMLPPAPPTSIRVLACQRLHFELSRFHDRQKQLCRHWDDRRAHKLRISGKHVRYLLEPFADIGSPVEQCIEMMKHFQDRLGGHHDYVMLLSAISAYTDEIPAAAKRLAKAISHLRERVTAEYCQSKQLYHMLQEAMQFMEKENRKEDGNVV